MNREETLAIYDARAGDYAGLTEDIGESRQLAAFAAALPEGARVLDLGCGPGFYAGWLAQRGFEVDAWDGSGEMVTLARQQSAVRVRQAFFDDLNAAEFYDGVWANFSLLHAHKADFPGLLRRVFRSGKPGMTFCIAMKLGQGEGPDAIGRYYAYYSEEELETHLTDAGFRVIERWRGKGTGLSGEVAEHAIMLCHG